MVANVYLQQSGLFQTNQAPSFARPTTMLRCGAGRLGTAVTCAPKLRRENGSAGQLAGSSKLGLALPFAAIAHQRLPTVKE